MKAIADLVTRMEVNTASSPNENTYIDDDGLKHCSICNDYLETYIDLQFIGGQRKVPCICTCTVNKMKAEEEAKRNYERQEEIRRLQKNSLLGDRYKDVRFSNTRTGENPTFDTAFKRCRNYCEVSSNVLENGYGIYIYGDSGTGKTHLTACMVNELVRQQRPTLFTNFFEISQIIRGTFKSSKTSEIDMIEKIANIDFLFLDDLGTEKVIKNGEDNWLQEKIFEILNKRYNNKKPTIFTSNYSLEELISNRGLMEKTVDRILEMSSLILKIEGESNRIKNRQNELPF